MIVSNVVAMSAVLLVCIFYLLAWLQAGRDPKPGTIVPCYDPPRNLSPAFLRYVWKEGFDDRVLWAAILSLVSKGLATIETEDSSAILHPSELSNRSEQPDTKHQPNLPKEERILLEALVGNKRKGIVINVLDGKTALMVARMAESLRAATGERWFRENRQYVIFGAGFSVLAVSIAAHPQSLVEWTTLAVSLALVAPGGFYLPFLVARLRDLVHVWRRSLESAVLRRILVFLLWTIPCILSFVMGSVVLGGGFGMSLVVIVFLLAGINITFLHLMKAPTAEGRKLLDEIEGFREFLLSVERLPMDRTEGPEGKGLYEEYLPYAVALELEQSWSDRFVALASSAERQEASDVMSFHIGFWDGKPVDIFLRPVPSKRY